MRTVSAPARAAHPLVAPSGHIDLADALALTAARLVATVHDEGPDAVARVLAQVPQARFDGLAVVLAAMVDPERSLAELLAWTVGGPVESLDKRRAGHAGAAKGSMEKRTCHVCQRMIRAGNYARHLRSHERAEQAA